MAHPVSPPLRDLGSPAAAATAVTNASGHPAYNDDHLRHDQENNSGSQTIPNSTNGSHYDVSFKPRSLSVTANSLFKASLLSCNMSYRTIQCPSTLIFDANPQDTSGTSPTSNHASLPHFQSCSQKLLRDLIVRRSASMHTWLSNDQRQPEELLEILYPSSTVPWHHELSDDPAGSPEGLLSDAALTEELHTTYSTSCIETTLTTSNLLNSTSDSEPCIKVLSCDGIIVLSTLCDGSENRRHPPPPKPSRSKCKLFDWLGKFKRLFQIRHSST
ncbi:uncharacterized protein BJ171DRAFT_609880 [Polychytrium aggregatum]|uniref:uncharacterized protein n=1 Tax=Polychytrium aggregatum TaxID=110093 RepID=UPI0022FEC72F|nr:uncharacterized protein BJ171DRAFT_609880 [Polychytrium aggregatum]KAI9206694.1 hypothetical protein BJ171DRAFT_609880 [Polychytrium aggregatum]